MASICLKNIGKWVSDGKKKRWLFRHVSFSLPSKGFFAISGPSGCGKSTFLSLLSGLSKPSEGKILVGKRSLKNFSAKDLSLYRQKAIGLVFQHYNLIDDLSVLDNVMLPGSFSGKTKALSAKKAKNLLSSVGLMGKEKQLAGSCSGGEKQRIAICRSLMNDPFVLLCDEPTGALDEDSSENVMGLLKRISSKRLVIIVSHNQKLLERYVDYQWRIGEKCPCFGSDESTFKFAWLGKKNNAEWQKPFLKKNLKKHLLKNLICVFTASLGLVSGLLSFGYFKGNEAAIAKQARRAADYRTIRLQAESKVSVASSPLSLIETRRPSLEECLDLLDGVDADLRLDFSYFLPEASVFTYRGENKDPVLLYPVFSFEDPLLWEGKESLVDSTDFCLVNEAFAKRYEEIALGDSIDVPFSYEVEDSSGKKQAFYGDFEFEIMKVIQDFPFMSTPKIYYSFTAFENYFKEVILANDVSVFDCVNGAKDNASYSAFARFAFCKTFEDADRLLDLHSSKEEGVVASNNVRSAVESFNLLSKGTSWSLLAFTAISLLSVAVVTGMSNFSSFLDERKERAILASLGAFKGEVNSISYLESFFCALASASFSLLVCPLASYGGNLFFQTKFGLENLIDIPLSSFLGIPLLVPMIVFVFAIFFNLLCCSIPLAKANATDLSEELRDE